MTQMLPLPANPMLFKEVNQTPEQVQVIEFPSRTRPSALGMAYARGAQRMRAKQAQGALQSDHEKPLFVLELVVRIACAAFQNAWREVCAVRACSLQLRDICSEDHIWETAVQTAMAATNERANTRTLFRMAKSVFDPLATSPGKFPCAEYANFGAKKIGAVTDFQIYGRCTRPCG